MIRQKYPALLFLFLVVILFIAQGCLGKKETVDLMPVQEEPVSCSRALSMGPDEISVDDLAVILDRALLDSDSPCWERLMKTSLAQGRPLPMRHLARAVHAFNANETETEFSQATHAYFLGIAGGGKSYRENDRRLMKAYVGFEIKRAKTKGDERLKRAMRVCKRLDKKLYEKFFL